MTPRAKAVLSLLEKRYPHARMILTYSNNWELLVAVILSAQCTDVMVNKVTLKLFPKYRQLSLRGRQGGRGNLEKIASSQASPASTAVGQGGRNDDSELQEIINFAQVPIAELEQDIRSTGFYHNKAKNIQAAAKMVLDKYHGQIPKTMAEMLTIPGVARKTANVVLGNAYGIVEGIAVDTHVKKQAFELKLTTNTSPDKIEQDLMKLFDKKDWFRLTYLLIEHGRTIREVRRNDPLYQQRFIHDLDK